MRRRKPCTLARRRLFGWKVRLLMDVLRGRRWACRRRRRPPLWRHVAAGNWLKIRATWPPVKRGPGGEIRGLRSGGDILAGGFDPTSPDEYVEQPAARPNPYRRRRTLAHESADEHVLVATGAC